MDGWVTIGTKLDTKNFDAQIKEVESKLNDIEATLEMASKDKTLFSTSEIKQMETEAEKLRNKLIDLRKKQSDVGKVDLSKIKSSMSDILKKVAKWSLAIFGVRSAYSAVRSAISTISQYNEQFSTDLEYIKYALASSLQPVIERIVNLIKTLLTYINYVAKAWFGINLFASAKEFEKMKKSSSGIAKNMKEASKQTATFDEMNILSDSSSSSAGNGTITAPSFDLANWEDIKIPSWLQWIADNKDLILGFFTALGLAITGIKITNLLDDLGLLGEGVSNLDKIVKGLGIGLIFAGLALTIKGIIDFINDPSWENFLTILEGIALIVAGISLLTGNWVLALAALGAAIVLYVIQNWDKVKTILGKVTSWINEKIINPVKKAFGKLWDALSTDVKNVLNGIWSLVKSIINFIIGGLNNLIKGANKISFDVPSWVPGIFFHQFQEPN